MVSQGIRSDSEKIEATIISGHALAVVLFYYSLLYDAVSKRAHISLSPHSSLNKSRQ
ncbi:hypothetical protein BDV27DRAFT_122554 [Aspergillus caelatus]|uniref:Uncharacterized protein n=1 Tax=Aspergillus caelatus TaxID=61420 RepID=A0A5N7AF46_9EURO|nr:uncharacterized protein BDV27DRAFT_122554 [Aspergillus caelatus]KAE8368293.1 hypothetical protein BDV27DRAFT_122554 [Aspergillus caelatus]